MSTCGSMLTISRYDSLHFPAVGTRLTVLQYLNGKAAYVENIWKVINWSTSEKRFTGSREDVFKVLKASL